jgi:hypothetical protein
METIQDYLRFAIGFPTRATFSSFSELNLHFRPASLKCRTMNQAALNALKELIATSAPPHLGPQTRAHTGSISMLEKKLSPLLASVPAPTGEAIRAAILLWHDHLDAAHAISQNMAGADGSYLHGIMHRREPDYSNAKYWFHRVGKHRAFSEVAKRVDVLLKSKSAGALEKQLLPNGEWDSFAFIDACQAAANRSPDSQAELLRAIQAIEIEVLLEHLCNLRKAE